MAYPAMAVAARWDIPRCGTHLIVVSALSVYIAIAFLSVKALKPRKT